jgi:hypothetical protein
LFDAVFVIEVADADIDRFAPSKMIPSGTR